MFLCSYQSHQINLDPVSPLSGSNNSNNSSQSSSPAILDPSNYIITLQNMQKLSERLTAPRRSNSVNANKKSLVDDVSTTTTTNIIASVDENKDNE